jgi:hypothetical protein
MKVFISILLVFVMSLSISLAQNGKVTGFITDESTQKPVANATVKLLPSKLSATTTSDGTFTISDVPAGDYSLEIIAVGYAKSISNITVSGQETQVGKITVVQSALAGGNEDVVISLSDEQIDDNGEGGQKASGILHGSTDIFTSTAGYTFGPMRFKIRGYDQNYSKLYVDGIEVNNEESDYGSWYLWGGLNDVTRNKDTYTGLNAAPFTFGDVGGETNILTRASEQRTGTHISYAATNGNYKNRIMGTYSTGLMQNGWAFTVSASRRWAEEGYVQGTFYDAYSYFGGIEKKFNSHHSLGLSVFGAPSKSGKQGASTQEVYDLTGNNNYNPYWGWQDGKKRNSRVGTTNKPMALLTHYWTINDKSSLTTTVSAIYGTSSTSALNWFNAADPRPDYYIYLPSYLAPDTLTASGGTDAIALAAYKQRVADFANGDRQIKWDDLYLFNKNNYQTDASGINGDSVKGNRSEYIVENWVDNEKQYAFNTNYSIDLTDKINLTAGVQYHYYTGFHYKTVNDLLGGDYIVDVDKYAERDFPSNIMSAQSDIRYPNRIVHVGDKFGYDYNANVRDGNAWVQTKIKLRKFDFFAAANYSTTTFWRTGNMQNGLFPNNSLGDSQKKTFNDPSIKGGAVFKINGRNYLYVNAGFINQAPNFKDSYISPKNRDAVVNDLKNEQIKSVDGGYLLRTPFIKASLNLYYTEFNNQVWMTSFYHDGLGNFVNYAMSGINTTHSGAEVGIEAKLSDSFTATAVGSFGYYRYTSNPTVTITVDNSAAVLAQDQVVYEKGFLVAGTPQTAASVGLKYSGKKKWFLSVNGNYMANNYLSLNPTRRTQDAVADMDPTSLAYKQIIAQEKLPSAYTMDASIGKTFRRIKHKYEFAVSLNVSNILNNTKFITGGYEQLRFDNNTDPATRSADKFPPKYYYYYGTIYYLNIGLRF